MAETRQDEGFHEIQLSGKQLVFLFMATTVVAVVIFLCGVLVGRGVRAERAAAASATPAGPGVSLERPPAAAADPSAPPASGQEDLSYPKRLQGEQPDEQVKDPKTSAGSESPPAPADAVPPDGASGPAQPASGWVVQIAALRDRAAAVAIIQRLTAKGYPAFIVEPAPGAPAPGYRVRVGRFTDRREAERVSRRLEREEQFRPFITR